MPPDERTPRAAHCPRCGYDLRGTVATWAESCPLGGVCNECGLEFAWRELLNPAIRKPQWCVEYGRGWFNLLRRVSGTIAYSFAPMKFWRDLKMTHEIRWRRIALYIFLLLAILYIIFAGSQGLSAWKRYEHARGYVEEVNRSVPAGSLGRFIMPPAWQVVGRAILLPLSGKAPEYKQPHTLVIQSGSWRFDLRTPQQLLQERTSGAFHWEGVVAYVKAAAFPTLLNMGIALGFLLLPVTRRIAKVRWRHIARIAAYAELYCLIPIGFMCFGEGRVWNIAQLEPPNSVAILTFFAAPIGLVVWWSIATGHHLRLDHSWGVVVALALIAIMLLLMSGYYTFMIWHWEDLFIL